MKNRLFWGLVAGLVLMMGISTVASAESTAADRPGFTAADSEFYLEDQIYFFFRPGLVLTITDYEIPSDLKPLVTFTLTDPGGMPLDMNGVYTPGPIDITRWFVSYIPVGEEQIVNYITGPAGLTYDRGGTITTVELGTYTYKYAQRITCRLRTGRYPLHSRRLHGATCAILISTAMSAMTWSILCPTVPPNRCRVMS